MASSLTALGFIWSVLSIIAAILCCSGFYLPFWIQGRLLGKVDAYFSSFRRCNYPSVNSRGTVEIVEECGRYTSFWDIPSHWWQASTVLVGTGSALSLLIAVTATAACCLTYVIHAYTAKFAGSLQLFAALLILAGTALYPVGWDNREVRESCGNTSHIYKLEMVLACPFIIFMRTCLVIGSLLSWFSVGCFYDTLMRTNEFEIASRVLRILSSCLVDLFTGSCDPAPYSVFRSKFLDISGGSRVVPDLSVQRRRATKHQRKRATSNNLGTKPFDQSQSVVDVDNVTSGSKHTRKATIVSDCLLLSPAMLALDGCRFDELPKCLKQADAKF